MKAIFEYDSKMSPLKKPTWSLQLVPTVFYLVTFTYVVFMVKKKWGVWSRCLSSLVHWTNPKCFLAYMESLKISFSKNRFSQNFLFLTINTWKLNIYLQQCFIDIGPMWKWGSYKISSACVSVQFFTKMAC